MSCFVKYNIQSDMDQIYITVKRNEIFEKCILQTLLQISKSDQASGRDPKFTLSLKSIRIL